MQTLVFNYDVDTTDYVPFNSSGPVDGIPRSLYSFKYALLLVLNVFIIIFEIFFF